MNINAIKLRAVELLNRSGVKGSPTTDRPEERHPMQSTGHLGGNAIRSGTIM